MNEETKKNIGRALGQIPSGASVLTATHGGYSTGMLASWVQQAGFEPPAITVAVKKGRPISELIESSGHFVVNLIGEERAPLFKHFSKGFGPGEPSFEGLAVTNQKEGVVLTECVANLRCKLTGKMEAGDHQIYVGEVLEAAAMDAKPYVHLRSNGLRY